MLRKRTRSHQKDQHMNNLLPDSVSESYFHSDISNQKHKTNSLLKVPGLFVGFNPRSSESDSVRSPTSPLDFRIFSSFGNPFRCPRSQNEGYHKTWDRSKVGLSIIDSLDETKNPSNVTRSSENKSILVGPQMNIKVPIFSSHVNSLEAPKSLPKDAAVFPSTQAKPANIEKRSSDVVFEIGEPPLEPEPKETFRSCSMDSGRYGSYLTHLGNRKSRFGSGNLIPENVKNPMTSESGFIQESLKLGNSSGGSLSSITPSIHPGTRFFDPIPASDIELSEDYTCVRKHGPNPKVTHIYGDCILGHNKDEVTGFLKKIEGGNAIIEAGGPSDVLASYPPEDFLKLCYSCKKKLDGEDIYMYRLVSVIPCYLCVRFCT